jgi:hypothetical protein
MSESFLPLLVSIKEAVVAAELPDEWRLPTFLKLLDWSMGAGAAIPPPKPGTQSSSPAPAVTQQSSSASIAARLGVSAEVVEDAYDLSEDMPRLVVSPGRLDGKSSTATKQIALLLAAARQSLGTEEWTSVGIVRDVCKDYRRLDQSNFASTVAELDDEFLMRGSPRQREIKLSRVGWERARNVLLELDGSRS